MRSGLAAHSPPGRFALPRRTGRVLLHFNRKRHLHYILRAGLAFLTDGSASEYQLRRAGVLSGELPHADLAGLYRVPGGLLQRQIARYRGGALPHLAEWQINFDYVSNMRGYCRIHILQIHRHVWFWPGTYGSAAGATIGCAARAARSGGWRWRISA